MAAFSQNHIISTTIYSVVLDLFGNSFYFITKNAKT